ncbi:MAG: MutS2/Smr-associated SH3 domain-containing protein [Crocinitomicaceae bacterium]
MYTVDEQTLYDLEFPTIREWLVGYAIGPTAQGQLEKLSPSTQEETILKGLWQVNELLNIREQGETFPALQFEELAKEIRLLPIRNSVLPQEGFVKIAQASYLVNRIIYFFDKREKEFPELSGLLHSVFFTEEIIQAIDKVFDRKGEIKDDASPTLLEIRNSLKSLKVKINRNFDKEIRRLSKENILGDTKEAFINDRRVLTIVSTHKRKVEGNVMGSSKSGSMTFVEPQINLELNREYDIQLDEERKEILVILKALTKEVAQHADLIAAYQVLLTELDFINAKTRLALELKGVLPNINKDSELELIDAFHPILRKSNTNLGKPTFPQHLKMDKFSRMLVISGPNAGGKSITLKTVGLLQVMLQSGLMVPVNPNSKMFFFNTILTDIGDNQSIENELSTYSYRLKRMKHFLNVTNKRTLLLLDEFGTGSDPDLGGALAEVFFEELYNRKAFGVITTHYANIKLKADQLRNAINGCMLFDTETLAPLYKFSIGQPGSSFTFEVAQINGIPKEIIEEAKLRTDQQKIRMDKLLSELQKEKTYLQRLNQEHIDAQEKAEEARLTYTKKQAQFDEKLKTLQDNAEKNNNYLNAGKKMLAFIDLYKTNIRKKGANQPLLDEVLKYLKVEKTKKEEKRKVLLVEKQKVSNKKPKVVAPEKDQHERHKIKEGSRVRLIATRQSGTVESITGENVVVLFGFMRMKVELEKLSFVS